MYGPPEESEVRQAQVTTLVNNLRNTGGDVEVGPCGKYLYLAADHKGTVSRELSLQKFKSEKKRNTFTAKETDRKWSIFIKITGRARV